MRENVMEKRIYRHIDDLVKRYSELNEVSNSLVDAFEVMKDAYENGGKLLVAGNGGSAADAEHIVGELMKGFLKPRPISTKLSSLLTEIDPVRGVALSEQLEVGLMAIPLVSHEALTTAYVNDVGADGVFAQQLLGFGRPGDVFLGITTSGNSENIIKAAVLAKALGIKVIGLTGKGGGELERLSDVIVKVPQLDTYIVQELHLPIYHCWCIMLEDYFF